MLGTITFGVVAWFIGSGLPGENSAAVEGFLPIVFAVVLAIALGVVVFLSKKVQQAGSTEANQLTIVGWAAAESTALLGAIVLLISGNPLYFMVGGLFFVVAMFVILPIRSDP